MDTRTIDRHQESADTGSRHAQALRSTGVLEVLHITRAVKSVSGVLRFSGVPGSSVSHARALEVAFVDGEAPAPAYDPASRLIRLFYPRTERPQVEQLLTRRWRRLCYCWRSADGSRHHAWLIGSPS